LQVILDYLEPSMDNGYSDINGEMPLGNETSADARRQSAEERRRAAQERIETRRLAREKERETNPRKRKTIVELTGGTSSGSKSRAASKSNGSGESSGGSRASSSSRGSSTGTSRASKPRTSKASEPAPDPSLKSRYVTEYQHVGGTTPLTEEMLRAMPKKRRGK